uniref:Uncharacterized protein n=1 Tax=Oryzias sinensis TaxID=183150 RepID=A0A8C8DRI2_9TELE
MILSPTLNKGLLIHSRQSYKEKKLWADLKQEVVNLDSYYCEVTAPGCRTVVGSRDHFQWKVYVNICNPCSGLLCSKQLRSGILRPFLGATY